MVGTVEGLEADRVAEIEKHTLRRPNVFGPDVISLASGDPAGLVPHDVVREVRSAMEQKNFGYTHPYGMTKLREHLADWITKQNRNEISASQILVTQGASSGLAATFLALLNPGDRVLLPTPTYSLYADAVRLAGGLPEAVPAAPPDFLLPIDRLTERAPDAKMIVICNPCNPTGVVYRQHDLQTLIDSTARTNVLMVVDEAYSSIVYQEDDFDSALTLNSAANRIVMVDTFSKRLGVTGLRLGYLVASPDLIKPISRVHHTLLGPVSTPLQAALDNVLGCYAVYAAQIVNECDTRRATVAAAVESLRDVHYRPPDGTFYSFLGLPWANDSAQVADKLRNYGVAIRPGIEFGAGGEHYIRLAFCGDQASLSEGLGRLVEGLTALATAAG